MLTSLSHYFLSEWLWSLTLGLYHMPINIFIMIGLSIFILRQRTVPAVLLSVSANLFSFLIFIAIGYVLHIDYVPEHDDIYVITNMALGCGALGIIYAVLQTLYVQGLRWYYELSFRGSIIMIWVSNLVTAFIMYRVLH